MADLKEVYRAIFEQLTDAALIFEAAPDAEDFLLYDINRAGRKNFGLKPEDAGKSVCGLFPGNEELASRLKEVWITERPVIMDGCQGYKDCMCILKAGGKIFSVCNVVYDENAEKNNPAWFKEKQSPDSPESPEDLYLAFIDLYPRGIISYDSNSRINVWNRKMEKISGLKAHEVLGKNASDFSFVKNGEQDRFREAGDGISHEIPYNFSQSGRKGWIESNHFPLKNKNGEVTGGVAIITDITKCYKTEEALTGKELFENAFRHAPIGMALTFPDGRWFHVNQPFCDLTGYSREEMEKMKFQDITYPEDLEQDLHLVGQILGGKIDTFQMEKRYIHKTGKIVWAHISISLLKNEDRTPRYFIAQIQDISNWKTAEAELIKAKEEAESAVEMKDKFVSLIAHDLRNPASSIARLLELATLDLSQANLSDEQTRFLELAVKSAKKMNQLINDLLNMSRLKSGMLIPRLKYTDAGELIGNVLKDFESTAKQKGIKLRNLIPKGSRIYYTDSTLFEQVLINLISNAIKFSREEDSVTIYSPEQDYGTVAVSDSGTGIQPDIMKYIFDYNKKTSLPGTGGETGTGLGLPLSLDIMKTLGGSLKAESAPEKGSVFYASLPSIKPVILIVDDEELFRMEQGIHLNKLDVEIMEASSGEEALAKIKTKRPNLIITDICMPEMDGIDLLKIIKTTHETESIPVIAVTGLTGMEIRDKAFRNGADDFVQKPLEPEELVPRVKRFLW